MEKLRKQVTKQEGHQTFGQRTKEKQTHKQAKMITVKYVVKR